MSGLVSKTHYSPGALVIALYLPLVFAEDIVTLPPVTVSARAESLQQPTGNTEFLDEDDITRMHQRSISDVLQGTAGYSFSRLGGIGATGVTLLRGAGGQGVMTLDDIPLLQSIPGSHLTDTLPSEAIQRAEIQRGPSESYYPFQALGGTIRLYTHDRDTSGGKVSVEGGSFGLLRETLQSGLAGKAGRVTATLTRMDAFDGTHFANAFDNPERDPFRYTQGIFRFTGNLSNTARWEGSVLYRNSAAEIDKFGLSRQFLVTTQDDPNSFRREETWLAQNKLSAQLTRDWESQLQLGFTQAKALVNAGPIRNAIFSRLYLVNWRNRHRLFESPNEKRRLQWYWGGQGRYEQGMAPLADFSQHRTSAAGFAGMEFQYRNISGGAGVRVENFDRYGTHSLLQAAASWRIRPDLTLRVSGGTGYRLPAYSELLFLFFGNPALKPERAASGEFGIAWRPSGNLQLGATGFYHHYQDLISIAYSPKLDLTPPSLNTAYDPHPANGPVSANIANAAVAGFELSGQYNWGNEMDTGFSYTYSDSRDLNTHKLLPLRPRHSAKFWEEWRMPEWPLTLRVETVYRNRAWNDFNNQFPVKDSVQINASLRYRIFPNVEAYLRGENLSDNRHAFVFSFDTPGVALYGGFDADF